MDKSVEMLKKALFANRFKELLDIQKAYGLDELHFETKIPYEKIIDWQENKFTEWKKIPALDEVEKIAFECTRNPDMVDELILIYRQAYGKN